MPQLKLDDDNALFYEHHAPRDNAAQDGARPTFVFVNALTGNTQHWEAAVAPALRAEGFGTLVYNFRGQDSSPFTPGLALTPTLIIDDLKTLMAQLAPARPVLVGLSIGGLFAAHAILQGTPATGLVLLNTLRRIGPRIAWVNDALPVIAKAGGVGLLMDAMLPLLTNQEFAAKARAGALTGAYEPLATDHGHYGLMAHASAADWDIAYEGLTLPTLVISGLQDRVFYDAEDVDALYARLPQASREDWPDAGHLLPLERPEALAHSLAAFGHKLSTAAR
ncbi:MAG: alpha/beta fold hydrolase [Pseudomonadota bacterium]